MTLKIPLLASKAVLFPGGGLLLGIYERSYQIMATQCLKNNEYFGACLAYEEDEEDKDTNIPHTVGTLAKVTHIHEGSDGGMNVSILGERRFRIKDYVQDAKPYLFGEVEIWDDEPIQVSPILAGLVTHLRQNFNEYYAMILSLADQFAPASRFTFPNDLVAMSYQIAQNLQIEISERQMLLEMESVVGRLERELALLQREKNFLQRLEMLQGHYEEDELSPWGDSINL
jgi:uncharacterized protein